MSEWKPISEPPADGLIVETRVNDGPVTELLLHRTLWWEPDMSVMATETPTHWRERENAPNFGDFNAVLPLLSVPENGTIVVAGAYKGDYLEYFSARFPTAFLFGYEPSSASYKEASERLKNEKQCVVANFGLATNDRRVMLGNCGSDGCSAYTAEGNREIVQMRDAVQTLPSNIDLLVLNCEGSEWALLPYLMDEMMHHRIAAMAVQFHPEYVSEARAQRVLALVDEYYERKRFDYPAWCYFVRKGI